MEGEDSYLEQLPTAFGKSEPKSHGVDLTEVYKRYQRESVEVDEPGSSSDDDDDDDEEELPISHEVSFEGHEKLISGISCEASGARFVTSSYDETIKLWDFGGMDRLNRTSFRTIEPLESHQIHQAVFSSHTAGNIILVIPKGPRAKLYSRDGDELGQFTGGDMYLVDMKNTKGHVGEIFQGQWAPQGAEFATAGSDSTVRIWDASKFSSQKSVIVLRNALKASGQKTTATALNWLSKSSLLSGSLDGALRLWDTRGPLIRPSKEVLAAHKARTHICSIAVSSDSSFFSRGGPGDESLKLWDTRQLKSPVITREGLSTMNEEAAISLSPTDAADKYIISNNGKNLEIMDQSDLMTVKSVSYDYEVTQTLWNSRLNQIFVGLGNGEVRVLFSPQLSKNGVKTTLGKAPKVRHIDDLSTANISLQGLNQAIMDRENAAEDLRQKQRIERERAKRGLSDAVIQPEKPSSGVWGVPDPKHLRDNVPLSERLSQDPREKLLELADRAAQDPRFKGYNSQPKIYAKDGESDEDRLNKKPRNE